MMEPNIEKHPSHPFGDLLKQHLNRRQGLSQNKLAVGIDVDPAVISDMSHGRRLNGPSARARVLAMIRWLHAQEVLSTEEEATALLEAAGMARLNTHLPNELGIDLPMAPVPNAPESPGQKVNALPQPHQQSLKIGQSIRIVGLGLIGIGFLASVLLGKTAFKRHVPIWQENFNPIGKRWNQISAVWEDVAGPTAILRETNSDANVGKVESEIITLDVDSGLVLRINVMAIDLGGSYTVQVLDKRTNISKDVIQSIASPGEQTVDISQQMGWHGVQSFTINLWIGGEGKSATFGFVRIDHR
jgi:hypothetical protein